MREFIREILANSGMLVRINCSVVKLDRDEKWLSDMTRESISIYSQKIIEFVLQNIKKTEDI